MKRTIESAHLREYLRIVRKHVWLIAACFLVIAGAAAAGHLRAAAHLQCRDARSARARGTARGQHPGGDSLGRRVHGVLPDPDPDHPKPAGDPAGDRCDGPDGTPSRPGTLRRTRSRRSLRSVAVEPVRGTRLVEIRVEDTDPAMAAEIANAIASGYVRQTLELKLNAARDALTWLTTQVSDLKGKVNESELNLQRYREQAGLTSAEERQNLVGEEAGRVQQRLTSTPRPSVSSWRPGSTRSGKEPRAKRRSSRLLSSSTIRSSRG